MAICKYCNAQHIFIFGSGWYIADCAEDELFIILEGAIPQ
jgi:hypothetical protein